MKTNLHTNDITEIINTSSFTPEVVTNPYYSESRIAFENDLAGQGSYLEYQVDDFKICYGNSKLKNNLRLKSDGLLPSIEMHFALSGLSSSNPYESNINYSFGSNEQNFLYLPYTGGETLISNAKNFSFFEVHLSYSFFGKLCDNSQLLLPLLAKINNQAACFLNGSNGKITPEMYSVIREIMNCKFEGHFKKLFIEAKIIELFIFQVTSLTHQNLEPEVKIKKQTIDKIYHAQEIILKNLTEPYSLIELARLVGLNDCTLKKGFKQLFGTTVFNYLRESRMKKAKTLLLDGELNINEVAHEIGYKNHTHFTAAFKRKYGVLPSKLVK